MTCRNCKKIGHIEAFCENDKAPNTNVQDMEVHEEAVLELCDTMDAIY
jgi:hypothetical protein